MPGFGVKGRAGNSTSASSSSASASTKTRNATSSSTASGSAARANTTTVSTHNEKKDSVLAVLKRNLKRNFSNLKKGPKKVGKSLSKRFKKKKSGEDGNTSSSTSSSTRGATSATSTTQPANKRFGLRGTSNSSTTSTAGAKSNTAAKSTASASTASSTSASTSTASKPTTTTTASRINARAGATGASSVGTSAAEKNTNRQSLSRAALAREKDNSDGEQSDEEEKDDLSNSNTEVWISNIDTSSGERYFVNQATGDRVWSRPKGPGVVILNGASVSKLAQGHAKGDVVKTVSRMDNSNSVELLDSDKIAIHDTLKGLRDSPLNVDTLAQADVHNIEDLLKVINMSQHAEKFKEEQVTLPELLFLTDNHLEEMGFKMGERVKLMHIIRLMRAIPIDEEDIRGSGRGKKLREVRISDQVSFRHFKTSSRERRDTDTSRTDSEAATDEDDDIPDIRDETVKRIAHPSASDESESESGSEEEEEEEEEEEGEAQRAKPKSASKNEDDDEEESEEESGEEVTGSEEEDSDEEGSDEESEVSEVSGEEEEEEEEDAEEEEEDKYPGIKKVSDTTSTNVASAKSSSTNSNDEDEESGSDNDEGEERHDKTFHKEKDANGNDVEKVSTVEESEDEASQSDENKKHKSVLSSSAEDENESGSEADSEEGSSSDEEDEKLTPAQMRAKRRAAFNATIEQENSNDIAGPINISNKDLEKTEEGSESESEGSNDESSDNIKNGKDKSHVKQSEGQDDGAVSSEEGEADDGSAIKGNAEHEEENDDSDEESDMEHPHHAKESRKPSKRDNNDEEDSEEEDGNDDVEASSGNEAALANKSNQKILTGDAQEVANNESSDESDVDSEDENVNAKYSHNSDEDRSSVKDRKDSLSSSGSESDEESGLGEEDEEKRLRRDSGESDASLSSRGEEANSNDHNEVEAEGSDIESTAFSRSARNAIEGEESDGADQALHAYTSETSDSEDEDEDSDLDDVKLDAVELTESSKHRSSLSFPSDSEDDGEEELGSESEEDKHSSVGMHRIGRADSHGSDSRLSFSSADDADIIRRTLDDYGASSDEEENKEDSIYTTSSRAEVHQLSTEAPREASTLSHIQAGPMPPLHPASLSMPSEGDEDIELPNAVIDKSTRWRRNFAGYASQTDASSVGTKDRRHSRMLSLASAEVDSLFATDRGYGSAGLAYNSGEEEEDEDEDSVINDCDNKLKTVLAGGSGSNNSSSRHGLVAYDSDEGEMSETGDSEFYDSEYDDGSKYNADKIKRSLTELQKRNEDNMQTKSRDLPIVATHDVTIKPEISSKEQLSKTPCQSKTAALTLEEPKEEVVNITSDTQENGRERQTSFHKMLYDTNTSKEDIENLRKFRVAAWAAAAFARGKDDGALSGLRPTPSKISAASLATAKSGLAPPPSNSQTGPSRPIATQEMISKAREGLRPTPPLTPRSLPSLKSEEVPSSPSTPPTPLHVVAAYAGAKRVWATEFFIEEEERKVQGSPDASSDSLPDFEVPEEDEYSEFNDISLTRIVLDSEDEGGSGTETDGTSRVSRRSSRALVRLSEDVSDVENVSNVEKGVTLQVTMSVEEEETKRRSDGDDSLSVSSDDPDENDHLESVESNEVGQYNSDEADDEKDTAKDEDFNEDTDDDEILAGLAQLDNSHEELGLGRERATRSMSPGRPPLHSGTNTAEKFDRIASFRSKSSRSTSKSSIRERRPSIDDDDDDSLAGLEFMRPRHDSEGDLFDYRSAGLSDGEDSESDSDEEQSRIDTGPLLSRSRTPTMDSFFSDEQKPWPKTTRLSYSSGEETAEEPKRPLTKVQQMASVLNSRAKAKKEEGNDDDEEDTVDSDVKRDPSKGYVGPLLGAGRIRHVKSEWSDDEDAFYEQSKKTTQESTKALPDTSHESASSSLIMAALNSSNDSALFISSIGSSSVDTRSTSNHEVESATKPDQPLLAEKGLFKIEETMAVISTRNGVATKQRHHEEETNEEEEGEVEPTKKYFLPASLQYPMSGSDEEQEDEEDDTCTDNENIEDTSDSEDVKDTELQEKTFEAENSIDCHAQAKEKDLEKDVLPERFRGLEKEPKDTSMKFKFELPTYFTDAKSALKPANLRFANKPTGPSLPQVSQQKASEDALSETNVEEKPVQAVEESRPMLDEHAQDLVDLEESEAEQQLAEEELSDAASADGDNAGLTVKVDSDDDSDSDQDEENSTVQLNSARARMIAQRKLRKPSIEESSDESDAESIVGFTNKPISRGRGLFKPMSMDAESSEEEDHDDEEDSLRGDEDDQSEHSRSDMVHFEEAPRGRSRGARRVYQEDLVESEMSAEETNSAFEDDHEVEEDEESYLGRGREDDALSMQDDEDEKDDYSRKGAQLQRNYEKQVAASVVSDEDEEDGSVSRAASDSFASSQVQRLVVEEVDDGDSGVEFSDIDEVDLSSKTKLPAPQSKLYPKRRSSPMKWSAMADDSLVHSAKVRAAIIDGTTSDMDDVYDTDEEVQIEAARRNDSLDEFDTDSADCLLSRNYRDTHRWDAHSAYSMDSYPSSEHTTTSRHSSPRKSRKGPSSRAKALVARQEAEYILGHHSDSFDQN